MSIKGKIGGGINDAFTRHTSLNLVRWSDEKLEDYDAIVLLDAGGLVAGEHLLERSDLVLDGKITGLVADENHVLIKFDVPDRLVRLRVDDPVVPDVVEVLALQRVLREDPRRPHVLPRRERRAVDETGPSSRRSPWRS